MEKLADILESELEDAFEVKNKKALRNYITILLENVAEQKATSEELLKIHHEIQTLAETTRLGFEHVDKRFEDMNKRFEDMNKRFEDMNKRFEDMNKRFEDMNKRFDDMNKKISILIWVVSLWMSLFTALSFVLKFFG